jgi:hypothetical protein
VFAVRGGSLGTVLSQAEVICGVCGSADIRWGLEDMIFWQLTDKGYVYCLVELSIGTCRSCGSKILDPDSDAILDAALRREYDGLP